MFCDKQVRHYYLLMFELVFSQEMQPFLRRSPIRPRVWLA
jgi:hypothetical protein